MPVGRITRAIICVVGQQQEHVCRRSVMPKVLSVDLKRAFEISEAGFIIDKWGYIMRGRGDLGPIGGTEIGLDSDGGGGVGGDGRGDAGGG